MYLSKNMVAHAFSSKTQKPEPLRSLSSRRARAPQRNYLEKNKKKKFFFLPVLTALGKKPISKQGLKQAQFFLDV